MKIKIVKMVVDLRLDFLIIDDTSTVTASLMRVHDLPDVWPYSLVLLRDYKDIKKVELGLDYISVDNTVTNYDVYEHQTTVVEVLLVRHEVPLGEVN